MSYTLVLEWMPGDLYMSAVTARCTAPTSSYSVVWLPPNKVYQITLYCGSTSLVSFLVGAFRGKAWSYMSSKTKGSKKLRDLIRVGVFSALWIAVGWIIGCTVGFFPPIMLALPCILAIFGALILVVMLSKITIRGGILISSSCSVFACFLWPPTALCLSALSLRHYR